MIPVRGEPLPSVPRVHIAAGRVSPPDAATAWVLCGVTSNPRYVTRAERDALARAQAPLGRPEAAYAALIPIRKTEAWWSLSQDDRRHIFEETSHHNAIGLRYLPQIARRLHHCRDLDPAEPFDFLTLFDYEAAHEQAFDDLVAALRETHEWTYVEREVDIRLERAPASG
jgi:chlorite dismutase